MNEATTSIFNWNLVISSITLIVAIISPVLVTIVNNIHSTKIRKLELRYKKQNSYYTKQQSIFENYLNAISKQLESNYESERIEYIRCYHELFLYVPDCYWQDIEDLHKLILNRDKKGATALLNKVTKSLGKVLQESDRKFPEL